MAPSTHRHAGPTTQLDAVYRFVFPLPLDRDVKEQLAEIPGVDPWWGGRGVVVAPYNVGWLVARELERLGSWVEGHYELVHPEITHPDVPFAAALAASEARGEIWGFRAHRYQVREAEAFYEQGGGSCWISPGGGKTWVALLWALSVTAGPVLYTVLAFALEQHEREVRDLTTVEPFLLLPTSLRGVDTTCLGRTAAGAGCGRRVRRPTLVCPSHVEQAQADWVVEAAAAEPPTALQRYLADCADANRRPLVLCSWEQLRDQHDEIVEVLRPQAWVADEIHRAKAHQRLRWTPTRDPRTGKVKPVSRPRRNVAWAAWNLAQRVPFRLGTSATPNENVLMDLYGQLSCIEPNAWGLTGTRFGRRYADARENPFSGGWSTDARYGSTGSSNTDEFGARVAFTARRVPYAVSHGHLPPMSVRTRRFTRGGGGVPRALRDEVAAVSRRMSKGASAELRGELRELQLEEVAWRKMPWVAGAVAEQVQRAFDPDDVSRGKVLVFYGRKAICTAAAEQITKGVGPDVPVWVGHGDDSSAALMTLQDRFVAHEGPCVLVGTYQAWGTCMRPEELVLGEDKAIAEYAENDRVLTAGGFRRVLGQTSRPCHEGQLTRIRATGLLPLEVTGNHPLLVWTPEETRRWVAAADVAPGDHLLIPRLPPAYDAVVFDLTRYVKSANALKGRRTRGWPLDVHLSTDFAWLLGLFVANGCASPNGPRKWIVSIMVGAQKTQVAQRAAEIMMTLGFTPLVRDESNIVRIRTKSSPLALLLRDLCGVHAENKRIPTEVLLNADLTLVEAFLDGYTAGDGYVEATGRMMASTASPVLARHLQLAVARLGRLAGIHRAKTTTEPKTIEGGKPFIPLPRYHVYWYPTARPHRARHVVLNDAVAVRVRRAETVPYTGLVYDIATTDQTFLASNAIVHNSRNLTGADYLCVAQIPARPGDLDQVLGRPDRQTRTRPVLAEIPVLEGSADEIELDAVLSKLEAALVVAEGSRLHLVRGGLRGVEDPKAVAAGWLAKLTRAMGG